MSEVTRPTDAGAAAPLYLASSSPRRRQLLTEAGIAFEQHAVPVAEEELAASYTGPLDQLGEYLAREKALAAVRSLRAGPDVRAGHVLAADTTVLLNGRSLAKPLDHDEALAMLRALCGREHIVATGVALADLSQPDPPHQGQIISATAQTRVLMREYADAEITGYVATGDPLDKAGAYSIQHPAFAPVERISGCHLGVIGLPICLVGRLLGLAPLPVGEEAERCPWSRSCTPPYPRVQRGPDDQAATP